ncbi:hypothetical protein E1B28_008158 [Marasmius oreades]|uniref:Uncharacterized protein n=1 Tax=Marasmius oreades TaxID=181124 RepID=A0A9P7URG9_9AGAR|nr:uncharacterized protein E1B28_008158 [Marasmius oreades]KAG7091757.1 hypothetical protein E1B28_008158 [Marasmius oreades]
MVEENVILRKRNTLRLGSLMRCNGYLFRPTGTLTRVKATWMPSNSSTRDREFTVGSGTKALNPEDEKAHEIRDGKKKELEKLE